MGLCSFEGAIANNGVLILTLTLTKNNSLTIAPLNVTRNLAIANRSRVSSAHTVTTVNFQGNYGEEAYGVPVVATAVGSINFSVG